MNLKKTLALSIITGAALPSCLLAAGWGSGMPFMGTSPYQNPLAMGASPFGMMNPMSPWGGGGLPMLGSGMSPLGYGMSPWSGMGGMPLAGMMPGMSPLSGMGGMPLAGMTPGMSPFSGMGGMPLSGLTPGMSPFSGMGMLPYNPYGGMPGYGYGMPLAPTLSPYSAYGAYPYLMPGAGMTTMPQMGGVNPMLYPRLY